ncbi:MAG: DNA double-strand break repair nuclease NurA [Chloroflexi bacterium]|nr:DNA double-strand break repair nuclease NurA [Chloroflexota bacterium]MBP8058234.1 DNA double-strand break repair nuclease NurA [Chloroflexota bacterium]
MALEFEKLTREIDSMGRMARSRQKLRHDLLNEAIETMRLHRTDWETLRDCVRRAKHEVGEKIFWAALPVDEREPLDRGIAPPPCPPQATLFATDGSQIMPDRHAPFLYYVINVGVMIYHHGHGQAPEALTIPLIRYPSDDLNENLLEYAPASVSIKRDVAEISTLARTVWENRFAAAPLIAILDQRLLYWPIGSMDSAEHDTTIDTWLEKMRDIQRCNGILAGYIDRPNKISVLNMLESLKVGTPQFDTGRFSRQQQTLTDVDLYSEILKPGERSPVFMDISTRNERFEQAGQAVCFFYLNPGRHNDKQIARVDVPIWAAQDPAVISQLHALIYHQCQILLGNYPYILTRADEVAVVGKQDQDYLDSWIALTMQKYGISSSQTNKQSTKDVARAGKTRHEM